jgi:hypothetical protein
MSSSAWLSVHTRVLDPLGFLIDREGFSVIVPGLDIRYWLWTWGISLRGLRTRDA